MDIPRDKLRWDPLDLEILHSLAGNTPAAEIARRLRRSREAVYEKASDLGLSLVTHICHKGHPMTREANRWRCTVCRTEYNREHWRRTHSKGKENV